MAEDETNGEERYLGLIFTEQTGRNMDSKKDEDGYMVPSCSDHDTRDNFYMDLLQTDIHK